MKRHAIWMLLLLLFAGSLSAQSQHESTSNLKKANLLYKQEDYKEAIRMYENELKKGSSSDLLYNLGNAYYKLDEMGQAILNYERALRVDPFNQDAKYNLKIAQDKVVDNVNTTPTFWIRRFMNALVQSNSSNGWAILSALFFSIMLVAFLIFAFSRLRNRRRIAFHSMMIAALVAATSFVFSGLRKDEYVKHNEAIIMDAATLVKSSPDKSGTDLFQLHEGTKVKVKSTLAGWTEIELENGAIGWLEENAIARI